MEEGVDGLVRDKTRPSRIRPLGQDVAERIVALTQQDPPREATHWTGAMMAKAVGVSVSSSPNCASRALVDPPAHAIVLSVNEKSEVAP